MYLLQFCFSISSVILNFSGAMNLKRNNRNVLTIIRFFLQDSIFAVIFHCLVDDLIHFSMYFPTLTLFISSFCFFLNELHKCCICVIYKNNVAIQTFFMQILKLNRKIWTSFWFHIIVDTKNLCNFQSFFFKYHIMYFFKNKNDCLCKLLIDYKKIFIFWVGYTIIALRTFFS